MSETSIDALTTTISNLEEGGELEKRKEIVAENKDMLSVKKKVDILGRRIQTANQKRRKIERSKLISASEKAKRIEVIDRNIDNMLRNTDAITRKANLPVYGTRH